MMKKLSLCTLVFFLITGMVVAQNGILWEDHFEDVDDTLAFKDVGWIRYGPEDGLVGQIVEQQDGKLFIEAGNYATLVGAGIVETNGTPLIDPADEDTTKELLVANNYSDPNQILSFEINFVRMTYSFFAVGTRMVQTDTSESLPDADPTESPAYVLFVSPLEDSIRVAKYPAVSLIALDPTLWQYFGSAHFDFDLDVFYRMKFYLNEGDLKAKVWEGDPADEPAEWLLEVTDPAPRVTGKFTMFGLMAPGFPPLPGMGDQVKLDDIVMESHPTGVEPGKRAIPNRFHLAQNRPNPFNPNTTIAFTLAKRVMTKLMIYNTRGQLIRTLVDRQLAAGPHTIVWDGLDESRNSMPTGIYIYRLTSSDYAESKRMILMK